MKKTILILLLTTLFSHALNLETYNNNRFLFSMDYPSAIFVNKKFPTNGDGIELTNNSKTLKLLLSGSYMVVSPTIEEEYEQRITWMKKEKQIELTYKVQKKNWFVLSGYNHGYNHKNKTIFYEKRYSYTDEKGILLLVGYYFEYPIKEKEKCSKWIKIFNESFVYYD